MSGERRTGRPDGDEAGAQSAGNARGTRGNRKGSGKDSGGDSVFTVLVAAGANFGIAVAKAFAGLVSGSSAMLSESAHSVADTVTELMLFVALKRSARPADEEHPLGYGQARYVWALLASFATFVGGGVFALYDGVHALTHAEELGSPLLSYAVLGIAALLEGYSLRTGVKQVREEASGLGVRAGRHLRRTPDTTVKAVVLEDTAAMIGLALAALGLLLGQLTGSSAWDGIASLCIGVLLIVVAVVLGRSNAELLIGRPLPSRIREGIRTELGALPEVEAVPELITLFIGADEGLVAAKVDFLDTASGSDVEQACELAEQRLRERYPMINRVYLDPTPARPGSARRPQGS